MGLMLNVPLECSIDGNSGMFRGLRICWKKNLQLHLSSSNYRWFHQRVVLYLLALNTGGISMFYRLYNYLYSCCFLSINWAIIYHATHLMFVLNQDNNCIVLNWPMTTTLVVLRSLTDFVQLIHILLQVPVL